MPKITKTKTTVVNILQVALDIGVFDETYRRIRSGAKYKGFQCYSCNRKFKDDEKISITITDKGNKVLCHNCAANFKTELEGVNNE